MAKPATITVPAIKLSVPLSASALPRDIVPAEGPPGEPVIDLLLEGGSLRVRAKVNGRNYRKMMKTVDEAGPENMVIVLGGTLKPPSAPGAPFTLEGAGFQAVVKTPKANPVPDSPGGGSGS